MIKTQKGSLVLEMAFISCLEKDFYSTYLKINKSVKFLEKD